MHDPDIESLLPLPPATFHILLALAERRPARLRHHPGGREPHDGEVTLSAGTLYRSIQRMLEQGLIVELARASGARTDDERRRYYRHHARSGARWRVPRRAALAIWSALARASGSPSGAAVSVRIYRLLLHLYPASFRAEYGEDAARFARRRRRRTGGGAAGLWLAAIADVAEQREPRARDVCGRTCATRAQAFRAHRLRADRDRCQRRSASARRTATFSIADHVLLRPLPFHAPDAWCASGKISRSAAIRSWRCRRPISATGSREQSFSAMAAYASRR